MKKTTLIKNATIINEGKEMVGDVLIKGGFIDKVASSIDLPKGGHEIDATGKYLIPGLIDDQVHFRQPGFPKKANIYTESKAAVAGGVTSFMEMPNTKPAAITQKLLQQKYDMAQVTSLANFSFFMGASNDNLEEVMKTNPEDVCGIKIFMGSSTGNMLVDDQKTLENIFKSTPMLVATHCEDENTVRASVEKYKAELGNDATAYHHPIIRNREACYLSSSQAVKLAKKHNTRLHILHISTADEIALFDNKLDLKDKKITAEACVHHLWFEREDYKKYGNKIKCNPAIKEATDRDAILEAVKNNYIDVIATDHAPHTLTEKQQHYWNAPSGVPLVQHSLQMMLEFVKKGKIPMTTLVQKMCHNPAILFRVHKRGFIKEGHFADLVLFDFNSQYTVNQQNIKYKVKWSPFDNHTFNSKITHTFVNGHLVFWDGRFDECKNGHRMRFDLK